MKMKKLFALVVGVGIAFMVCAVYAFTAVVKTAAADTGTPGAATPSTASTATSSLSDQIDVYDQQIVLLNQQISEYQSKLQQIGADKKTLQAAINSLDLQRSKVETQISLTKTQINITNLQIQQLGGQIENTSQAITEGETALAAYLRELQLADDQPFIVQLLKANNISDIWDETSANLQMESNIQGNMEALKTQKVELADTQAASKEKQATLTAQNQSLASEKSSLATTEESKNQLLADTNAQESNYQKLLKTAEDELNSFTTFVQNAGGSKLLPGQTDCDSWGCYYNQRDAAWGSDSLDGTKYTLASDGCLVTSLAMVMTHYGYRDVTPITINSNPSNFATYYPAYLLYTISVDGATVTRKTASIDATLASGNPVIVGIYAYGGTHYVVLTSGSKGHYLMRDPYISGGKDINFTDHYSVKSIFGIAKVVVNT